MSNETKSPMDEAAIGARLERELPHWRYEEATLRRRYRTSGWRSTMMVAGAIAHLAEAAWHHPDLLLSFGAVEVRLSTHDSGGITAKDFALAAKIEEVVGWRPGLEDGPLEGTPQQPEPAYIRYDD